MSERQKPRWIESETPVDMTNLRVFRSDGTSLYFRGPTPELKRQRQNVKVELFNGAVDEEPAVFLGSKFERKLFKANVKRRGLPKFKGTKKVVDSMLTKRSRSR